MLYLAVMLFGFGWFTTSPLTSGLVADLFGGLNMGTIIGVNLSCHTVGMALGTFGGGLTFELTGSYYAFFLTQGILELLAAAFAFAIKSRINGINCTKALGSVAFVLISPFNICY